MATQLVRIIPSGQPRTTELLGRLFGRLGRPFGCRAASVWSRRGGRYRRVGRRGLGLARDRAVLGLRRRRLGLVLGAILAFAADGKDAQCGKQSQC